MAPEKSDLGRHFIQGAIVKVNVTSQEELKKEERKMEVAVIVMAMMDLVPIVIGVVSAAVREGKKHSELQKAE